MGYAARIKECLDIRLVDDGIGLGIVALRVAEDETVDDVALAVVRVGRDIGILGTADARDVAQGHEAVQFMREFELGGVRLGVVEIAIEQAVEIVLVDTFDGLAGRRV